MNDVNQPDLIIAISTCGITYETHCCRLEKYKEVFATGTDSCNHVVSDGWALPDHWRSSAVHQRQYLRNSHSGGKNETVTLITLVVNFIPVDLCFFVCLTVRKTPSYLLCLTKQRGNPRAFLVMWLDFIRIAPALSISSLGVDWIYGNSVGLVSLLWELIVGFAHVFLESWLDFIGIVSSLRMDWNRVGFAHVFLE